MNLELVGALEELERERGIAKDILLEAIEAAIISAYKRNYGASGQNVSVNIDDQSGTIKVYAHKRVVDEVEDESQEISLEDAKRIDPSYDLDDVLQVEVTPRDFGRIAAQTAKQVVIQRIREAERALIYEEYSNKVGDIVTGIVSRREHRNVMVELGKVEAVLAPSDQMPNDDYSPRTRLKLYIVDVKEHTKGPQVVISRTHPMLLLRLFELEVPEIYSGIVEVKAVAREAGVRSKIAVASRSADVDPVGACVGPRGVRVQAVVSELRGEKVDIVAYSDNPKEFVANALSPARVTGVYINETEKSARVVVPDNQLSLAIGKEGQNARLAARLTGWKIDIKSEQQMAQIIAQEAFQRAVPKEEPQDTAGPVDESEPLVPVAGVADRLEAEEEAFDEGDGDAIQRTDLPQDGDDKADVAPLQEVGDRSENESEEPELAETGEESERRDDDEIDYTNLGRIEAFKLRLNKAQKAQQSAAKGKQAKSKRQSSEGKKADNIVLHDLSALKQFFGGDKEE